MGGIASLHRSPGQVVRTTQQIEGAVDLGQVLPGDMQIPGGRVDAPVTEQELTGPQIHPGFEADASQSNGAAYGCLCRG